MSIASIIGPPVMNELFSFFSREDAPVYFPGAAMLLGALLTLISALLARRTLKKNLLQTKSG
jgi:DHA1 family tetracycline resistance protein-like MFS transporter